MPQMELLTTMLPKQSTAWTLWNDNTVQAACPTKSWYRTAKTGTCVVELVDLEQGVVVADLAVYVHLAELLQFSSLIICIDLV